jgi:hypothetical protein
LEAKGAVGHLCLRFYDARGEEIKNPLHARVFGLELAQLKSIPSVVGVAGGKRKHQAILGASKGRMDQRLDYRPIQRRSDPSRLMGIRDRLRTQSKPQDKNPNQVKAVTLDN